MLHERLFYSPTELRMNIFNNMFKVVPKNVREYFETMFSYRIKVSHSSLTLGVPVLKNRECWASWEGCIIPRRHRARTRKLAWDEPAYSESVDPLLVRNPRQDSVSPPISETYQILRAYSTLLGVRPQGRILRAIVFRAPLKIVGSNTVEV